VSNNLQPLFRYTGVVTEAPDASALPPLAVLEDFLNTRDERSFTVHGMRHSGGDELATPAALASWLAGRGLIHAETPAGEADLRQAHALRQALREALAVRASGDWHGRARASGTLAGLSMRIEFDTDGTPRLSPVPDGAVPAALTRLAASAAAAAADGSWQRLKMCAAPDCRWVFHDTSRNGLGRWCSMRVCGNRGKTLAYRQRRGSSLSASNRT
jgi:predicted RNA-binding Zn ribbon-like protein